MLRECRSDVFDELVALGAELVGRIFRRGLILAVHDFSVHEGGGINKHALKIITRLTNMLAGGLSTFLARRGPLSIPACN